MDNRKELEDRIRVLEEENKVLRKKIKDIISKSDRRVENARRCYKILLKEIGGVVHRQRYHTEKIK